MAPGFPVGSGQLHPTIRGVSQTVQTGWNSSTSQAQSEGNVTPNPQHENLGGSEPKSRQQVAKSDLGTLLKALSPRSCISYPQNQLMRGGIGGVVQWGDYEMDHRMGTGAIGKIGDAPL